MLRVLSGMALLRSIAIVRPKPRHSGHAPSGLLKVKRPAVGGRISKSQYAQCQPVENGSSSIADCRLLTADYCQLPRLLRTELRSPGLCQSAARFRLLQPIARDFLHRL